MMDSHVSAAPEGADYAVPKNSDETSHGIHDPHPPKDVHHEPEATGKIGEHQHIDEKSYEHHTEMPVEHA